MIPIEDKNCWICGAEKFLTKHHVLPQHLRPINNVLVPICKDCHDRLNEEDFQSLYPFLTKISLSLRELAGALNKITKEFEQVESKLKLRGFLG
jgi:uncharacterized protein YlaI